MQKEKFDGTTTIEASWKIHSHRTFIFFYFLKVCRFCLYKDRPGSWPAVWHNEKRLRFVSNADISSCTVPPPRQFHRLRLQHHISFSFSPSSFFKFVDSLYFRSHLFPARRMICALAIPWKVSPSRASFLPFLLSPSFFLLALNKYRFRLSELTPVSALYPFLTRIEFRTEDRSLFVAIFSETRDHFPPLSFFFLSNDAGRRDRKCVGVFAQKGTSTKLNRYH